MFNTCKSIVSILLAVSMAVMVTAQKVETEKVAPDETENVVPLETDSVSVPLWQGVTIEADVMPLISNLLNDISTFRYEAAARINLFNKYYPVVEVGYEGQHSELSSGIDYVASGLFYRLGVDFNLVKSKDKQSTNNKFLVGARLGFSSFEYDMLNVKVRDEYTNQNLRQDFTDLTNNSLWFEVVAGIRIEVVKRVTLGWSVRMKNQIIQPVTGVLQPWSIPGYGLSGGNVWAFNYMIGYQF